MYENLALRLLNGQQEGELSPLPANPVVTMAYVPMQQFGSMYEPEQAWSNGTLFPELNKPFCAYRGAAK